MRFTASPALVLMVIVFPVTTSANAQFAPQYQSGAWFWGGGPFMHSPYGPFRPAGRSRGSSVSRGCLTADTQRLLSGLEAHFGAVKVISTCRPGAVIAGNGHPSQHRFGRAVDFVPHPGQRGPMIAWLRANAGGAVIAYASGHVHFDTGGYRYYGSPRARRAYARWR